MCDHCVIESVKERMLDRRSLFTAAALGTTAIGASVTQPAKASSKITGEIFDLSHELHEDFPTFFGERQLYRHQKFNFAEHKFNMLELRINEHTGTHIDAPLHFSDDGQSVAEIPVENLLAPLCVIDIRERALKNADTQLTPNDIKDWISKHGELPTRACVAMLSGWEGYLHSSKYRGKDWRGTLHFPGFHPEATQMLLEESDAVGIAVDTLSLDYGASTDFATHYTWLPRNRWGLENVANLHKIPAAGCTLFVGAPKHRGGNGGPCRLIAIS